MKSLLQLEIPKRTTHCSLHGEHLVPGMEVYSLLYDNEENRVCRSDYCAACWERNHEVFCTKPESRGYWKSKIEPRKQSQESSRTGRALALLKELVKIPESCAEEIFVLSLFLSHARQLALRQEFLQDGTPFQLYEVLRQEEFITIKAVNISHLKVEEIQKSLAEKVNRPQSKLE